MIAQNRGKNVSIAGALAQLGFTAVMLVIWLWTKSLAAMGCTLLLAGGLPLWLIVVLLFYVRKLERQEAAELAELAARGATTGTIFESEEGEELRPAAARAAFMDRWIVPIFTLLWAGLHATVGALLVRYLAGRSPQEIANAPQGMLLLAVIGFGAFLLSRYAIGMSRGADWRLLRATGGYLLVNVLFIVAVVLALVGADQGNLKIDRIVAYAAAMAMFGLAVELLLNLVFDLYRPRLPGQEHRPSFDSRLCNLIAEPGRVGHSIAEALNYQFGFEVSKTWFYQLISRAFIPLIAFAVLVMLAISSIVVVRHGQQCVVLHLGRAKSVLEPGVHFKWPWPIDTAQRFEKGKVHQVLLGVGEHREPVRIKGQQVDLWTEEHGAREELDFLLAVPPRAEEVVEAARQKPPPPVNIIKLVVTVQYVIDDVLKFGYEYTDPAKALECMAYREMSRYCASATLDSPIPGDAADRPEAIMTYGSKRAAAELKRRIQARADELHLGVRILYVGLSAVHPPSEAAKAYQAVSVANRRMLQKRYEAEGEANKTLVQVAGEPLDALKLALAIRTLEELYRLRDNPRRAKEILAEQIRQAEDDIKALEDEIHQERLLGKIRQGEEKTSKERLHEEYIAHLELLKEIGKGPGGFDFAGRIEKTRQEIERQFERTVGDPAKIVAEAKAYRWSQELTEMARAAAFRRELLAFQASPNMYKMDRWLDVWDEVLPGVNKYVLGVNPDKLEIWLNWEDQRQPMAGAYQEEPAK